jgi:cytochrome c oxidase cbb3-type subunit III
MAAVPWADAQEIAMRLRAILTGAITVVLTGAHVIMAQTENLSTAGSSDIAAGKRVFDAQCAWCHGADGAGGNGSPLRGVKLRHAATDAALVDILKTGVAGTEMPGFAWSLTDRTAWQTAAYVRSLALQQGQAVPGSPDRGAAVYEAKKCATCHIIGGRGGGLGPELTTIGALRGPASLRESVVAPEAVQATGYLVVRALRREGPETRGIRVAEDVFWIHIRDASGALHSFEKKDLTSLERELGATLMPSYKSLLSSSELDDLVAYLASLRGVR